LTCLGEGDTVVIGIGWAASCGPGFPRPESLVPQAPRPGMPVLVPSRNGVVSLGRSRAATLRVSTVWVGP